MHREGRTAGGRGGRLQHTDLLLFPYWGLRGRRAALGDTWMAVGPLGAFLEEPAQQTGTEPSRTRPCHSQDPAQHVTPPQGPPHWGHLLEGQHRPSITWGQLGWGTGQC